METTSKFRKFHSIPRQAKGYRRNQQAKIKSSAHRYSGNGFLTHRFLPLTDASEDLLKTGMGLEREFFISLSNLAATYNFEPLDVANEVYPVNISKAFQHASSFVKSVRQDLTLMIFQDETHISCLATTKPYSLQSTLFYIPVRPLCDKLNNGGEKPMPDLLLSVYAYLYQIVRIPFYRDDHTYLDGVYGMMEDWLDAGTDEWDEEDYQKQVANFELMHLYGDRLKVEMDQPIHLSSFEQRLKQVTRTDEKDKKLYALCSKFFDLYRSYPENTVFGNVHEGIIEPHEEDRIHAAQLVSFFWDYEDSLYESLIETINCEFQEKGITDEPLAMQFFDVPQQGVSPHRLDFEECLFELITELNNLI